MQELLRRDVLRFISLGAAGVIVAPGRAFAADKVHFRMDEQHAVHFLALHFIPKFLTKPVDWEVKQFASSGQGRISALMRGALDGVGTSWSYLPQMALNRVPITCVAGMAGGGSRLLVRAGLPIRSFADLKGKRIGVVEGNYQDIMFVDACRRKGIDPFKDVTRVNLSSPTGVIAGMSAGQVDACAIWEPYASILVIDQKAQQISNLVDDSFGVSIGGLYLQSDFVKKYPDVTQDVVDATVKATDYIVNNKQAWIERAREVTGQGEEVANMAIANCTPSLDIPMTTLRDISKAMYELNILERDVTADLGNYIDYTFLERATGKKKEQLGFSP